MITPDHAARPSLVERLETRCLMAVHYSSDFKNVTLTSTAVHTANYLDRSLENPQGLALFGGQILFTADVRTNASLAFSSAGKPNATFNIGLPGSPTSVTDVTGMLIKETVDGSSVPMTLAYTTSDGKIYGFYNVSNPPVLMADESATGADFSGAAITYNHEVPYLLAVDKANKTIDVFNSSMQLQTGYAFKDPTLPADYVPTNVAGLNYFVEVTYQKLGSNGQPLTAKGDGVVDLYSADGAFHGRISIGLYEPYGMAFGSKGYGAFDNDLIIADHFTGELYAYTFAGKYVGTVRNSAGHIVTVPGVWSLQASDPNIGGGSIFYSAEPGASNTGELGDLSILSGPKYGNLG